MREKTINARRLKWLIEYLKGQREVNAEVMEEDDFKALDSMIEYLES